MTSSSQPPLLRHQSVTDQALEAIRRMILRRELAPGRRITQAELAKRLAVSTMPVREALLRLSAEGLVVAAPGRSFHVALTSCQDIRDVFGAHAYLARELSRRAVASADEELEYLLRHHRADYIAATERGDRAAMDDANWSFHRTLHARADAPKLTMLLTTTLRFFPDFSAEIPGWSRLANRWQRQMIGAVRHRNSDLAGAIAAARAMDAAEEYIRHFHPTDPPGLRPRRPRPRGSSGPAGLVARPAPGRFPRA
jgi:DNA-binding GntR family transcriptional regulator